MVLPLLGAAIGAGGSIISGLLGNSAQEQANQMNYQIALLNYYQREAERQQAIATAQKQDSESKLGTTDAQGNRTYFKPGVGWVSELSPEQQALSDLYNQEETAQLTQDIPQRRAQVQRNIERQMGEDQYARSIRDAMSRVEQAPIDDVVGRRNRMAAEGITEGGDATLEVAMRNALRSGTANSNISKIINDVGSNTSDQLRKAFMQNEEGAREQSQADYEGRMTDLANMYNMFATRASAVPNAPYNPRNIEGQTAQALQSARGAGSQASGSLLNAIGRQGGTLDYSQQPQMGLANTVATTSRILASAFGNQYGNSSSGNSSYYPGAPVEIDPWAGMRSTGNMYRGNSGLY